MQDKVHGVPVRHQKVFLTSIPFAFMGYDLIEWLMDRLSIEDSLEAVHLANLLCQFGYFFPIGELKNLLVKDDSSLYRFQAPYYWPSQLHAPDNIEYAIYLAKRSQQRKREKHGLEDYEVEAYNNLKKILANRWEFVTAQSEEQTKLAKDRKRDDKQIIDSQERAYWRVYRPPPGYTTVVESSPVPTREQRIKARSKTKEHLKEEMKFSREYLSMSRCKVSFVADNLMDYTDTFLEFDPMLCVPGPSNPWITDDQTHWALNQPIVDTPTEKRVRKWELSLEDLVLDPLGVKELMEYMKKEYSHENLRFWLAVQELRYGPGTEAKIKKKVKEIWDEFLAPGAKAEINIDGKTMEATKLAMKTPTRFTFEVAASHVYLLLLKKDCYPRFIRSENYKSILANAFNPGNVRRRIFNFPKVPKRAQKPGPPPPGGPGTNSIPDHLLELRTTTTPTKENTKVHSQKLTKQSESRLLEDFNVYGAGGDLDSPTDGHDDLGFPHRSSNTIENVCPWDVNDDILTHKTSKEDSKNKTASGHVRRGSDPTNVKSTASAVAAAVATKPVGRTVGAIAAVATSALTTPLEATSTKPLPNKRSSSTVSSDDKNAFHSQQKCSPHESRHRHSEGGSGSKENTSSCAATAASGAASSSASSHHHHHHHHHHHAASRRAKNRSRKKKPSRTVSSAASSATSITGTPNENEVVIKHHDPPTHQHSAASLLTSVAAASLAMTSIEAIKEPLQATVASTTESSKNPLPMTESTQTMETKCTQTKLDDDHAAAALLLETASKTVEDQQQQQPPSLPASNEPEPAEVEGVVKEEMTSLMPSQKETEMGCNNPEQQEQQAVNPQATAATESKGEMATWTSSTEVCPWEDDTLTPTWL